MHERGLIVAVLDDPLPVDTWPTVSIGYGGKNHQQTYLVSSPRICARNTRLRMPTIELLLR